MKLMTDSACLRDCCLWLSDRARELCIRKHEELTPTEENSKVGDDHLGADVEMQRTCGRG